MVDQRQIQAFGRWTTRKLGSFASPLAMQRKRTNCPNSKIYSSTPWTGLPSD